MWLHEGLGSYMQPLYMQYLRGDKEYYASLMQSVRSIVNKAAMVSAKPARGRCLRRTSAARARISTSRARW